jgi:hypothetical protein
MTDGGVSAANEVSIVRLLMPRADVDQLENAAATVPIVSVRIRDAHAQGIHTLILTCVCMCQVYSLLFNTPSCSAEAILSKI